MTDLIKPPHSLNYKPLFPPQKEALGIGLVGVGTVAKKWHLTAYRKYGLKVVGVYDISAEATAPLAQDPGGLQIFKSLEELLDHPEIQIVDIATRPPGRVELMRKALQAGKHLLVQKPLAVDLREAYSVVDEAEASNLRVAVNQNGRWCPPWRLASLLIRDGAIGGVQSVTHLFDTRMSWMPTPSHGSAHFFIYDYSIHWIDINRCWLEDKQLVKVRAQDFPAPRLPADGSMMQTMWLMMEYADGTNALIRGVSCAQTHAGHPFWIHGTEGTIRGDVDCKSGDYVELEKNGLSSRYELEGNWFPDGFAGTMGELMCAVVEEREPYNSARHHLLTLETTLAACQSTEADGQPVRIVSGPA
jgi:predicted dehydrogenase